MSEDRKDTILKRKFREIVKYAYSNCALYEKYDINVDLIKNMDELPVIKKEDIMKDWENGISRKYLMQYLQGKLMSSWTSGSTGKCLRVLWTKEQYNESLLPLWMLRYKFYQIKPTDRFCYLYNTPNAEQKQQGDVIYEVIQDSMGFYKNNLTEEKICSIVEMMREYKPRWLMLQPSTAMLFAKTMEKLNLQKIALVEYLELSGEMLLEENRTYLKKIFNCTIANQYGCNELNSIAYECPEGNLHCLESNVFVEITQGGRKIEDGREGEICLTSLNNMAMPLVRYAIGDYGILQRHHNCKCGLRSPVLQLTSGRVSTYIAHKDGTISAPYIFIHAVRAITERLGDVIIQFHVIQKEYDEFDVVFVLSEEAYENFEVLEVIIEDLFLNSIAEDRLKECEFCFMYMNQILSTKNYEKFSYFESKLIN